VDLIVATLIALVLALIGAFAALFRSVDRRAAVRDRALLAVAERLAAALAPLRVVLPPSATPSPARGLQRLPATAFPPIVRRVVDVTRESETPAPPPSADRGAIVDVDLNVGIADDTTRGRWLRHVLGTSASPLPGSQEHRSIQRLHLVSPPPPDSPARADDTPAPTAQRVPILPPPSSPMRPSRR
jgi:hypothetical protein